MKSNSFINKVDPATAQPSAATLEAWDTPRRRSSGRQDEQTWRRTAGRSKAVPSSPLVSFATD